MAVDIWCGLRYTIVVGCGNEAIGHIPNIQQK